MKTWSILILALLLGACATPATMEELEAQAWATGDWSAVERREDALARRAAIRMNTTGLQCENGLVRYCESNMSAKRCVCVSHRTLERALNW